MLVTYLKSPTRPPNPQSVNEFLCWIHSINFGYLTTNITFCIRNTIWVIKFGCCQQPSASPKMTFITGEKYLISNNNLETTNNIISLVLWQFELTSLVPSYTWLYMVTRLKLSDWIIVWTNEMIWLRFDLQGDHLDICCG